MIGVRSSLWHWRVFLTSLCLRLPCVRHRYYELPKLYLIRPVMAEKVMKDLLSKNHDLLEITTQLVAKNEATAKLDNMALVDYATNE